MWKYETVVRNGKNCNMLLHRPPPSPPNYDISAADNHRGTVVRMDFTAASGCLSGKALSRSVGRHMDEKVIFWETVYKHSLMHSVNTTGSVTDLQSTCVTCCVVGKILLHLDNWGEKKVHSWPVKVHLLAFGPWAKILTPGHFILFLTTYQTT